MSKRIKLIRTLSALNQSEAGSLANEILAQFFADFR